MTGSAKGTLDNPGHKVKQKAGLNRSILRQGWGTLFNMLEYKLKRNGGQLIKVDPKNTSLACPKCNHTDKENRLTQENFVCLRCGYAANADLVGSWNILNRGLTQTGKENPCKTLPQGLREVTPVEYAAHTVNQEPVGNREEVPILQRACV